MCKATALVCVSLERCIFNGEANLGTTLNNSVAGTSPVHSVCWGS